MNEAKDWITVAWTYTANDKSSSPVSIEISKPFVDESGDWRCEVLIKLLGRDVHRHGYGADALDALACCMRVLAVEAESFMRDQGGVFKTNYGVDPAIFDYIQTAPKGRT